MCSVFIYQTDDGRVKVSFFFNSITSLLFVFHVLHTIAYKHFWKYSLPINVWKHILKELKEFNMHF